MYTMLRSHRELLRARASDWKSDRFRRCGRCGFPKATGDIKVTHVECLNEFLGNQSGDAGENNQHRWGKKISTSKTHFELQNLLYLQDAILKLKSVGPIKVRSPIADCEENGIIIEVHIDSGEIAKKGSKAQIGIFGFVRGRIIGMDKDQSCLGGPAIE